MEFRLVYRGPLKSSGNDVQRDYQGKRSHKHSIRQQLHGQIKELWKYPPLNYSYGRSSEPTHLQWLDPQHVRTQRLVGDNKFVCLVRRDLNLTAELDILFLRRDYSGALVLKGGDLDNRLKTLLDALRVPHDEKELPENYSPNEDENPLFCLLEDDALITKITLAADTLLISDVPDDFVHLVMHVRVNGPDRSIINTGEVG